MCVALGVSCFVMVALSRRRTPGWLIVCLSYGVAAYNVAKELIPAVELNDIAYSLVGFSFVLIVFAFWARSALQRQAPGK